jgi:hypothetical protein
MSNCRQNECIYNHYLLLLYKTLQVSSFLLVLPIIAYLWPTYMVFRLVSLNNVAHTRALMVQLKMTAETGACRALIRFYRQFKTKKKRFIAPQQRISHFKICSNLISVSLDIDLRRINGRNYRCIVGKLRFLYRHISHTLLAVSVW